MNEGHTAEAKFCEDGKTCSTTVVKGHWSNVYDQAIKVDLENGLRFLANYKYSVKKELSKNPLKDSATSFSKLEDGDYDKFDSNCA